MILFFIRLFIAICLYTFLVTLNQATIVSNAILAIGYRFFLIFSPLFERIFKKQAINVSLLCLLCGVLITFSGFQILAVSLIAVSLSISGFLIKKLTSESPSLAGLNKIALSLGNILAGLLLLTFDNDSKKTSFVLIGFIAFALYLSYVYLGKTHENYKESMRTVIKINASQSILHHLNIGWTCIGVAIGMRIFGLYSVLPAYLIKFHNVLPQWYGALLTIYGICVIFFQYPAVFKKFHPSLPLSLLILGFSCLIIGMPGLFYAHYFAGAIVWVFLLSIEEIFAPYIDFYSSSQNMVYTKEVSISIGAGLCALLTRYYNMPILISLLSITILILGCILINKQRILDHINVRYSQRIKKKDA